MRVSGLAPVEVTGIENINVTELVPGHMAYRTAMPKLLREVGWMVESDEFSEIEDPDPENHEQRQRELINEIEEARKELEKKEKEQGKKGGFFSWRKKKATKKDWEVYDENSQKPTEKEQDDPAVLAESTVMFDVDALRAEVAALSAEGIEIKEIKSTLPPMKIDMTAASPNPYSGLRETKSYNDSLAVMQNNFGSSTGNLSASAISGHSTPNKESRKQSFEEYDEHEDGDLTMTFDSSFKDPPAPAPSTTPSRSPALPSGTPDMPTWDPPSERPALKSATTEPNLNLAPGYNAWADEYDDEFGKEKEMKMTFE